MSELEDEGAHVPALEQRPELHGHLAFVWRAFWELGSDRAIGLSVGPIPFTAIDTYARRYEITDLDEFDRFVALIRAMEAVRAEVMEERRKADEAGRKG